MKLNTLFVAAVCASTLLNSCVFKTAQENQLKYTHTSLVDGDAFAAIQHLNATAVNGIKTAKLAEGEGNTADVAVKVKNFYTEFLPQLDAVSTKWDVTLNPVAVININTVDTTAVVEDVKKSAGYAHEAQLEIAYVKEQLTRLTKNTNEDLQIFAKDQLAKASELYTQIGGKEEAHAHH